MKKMKKLLALLIVISIVSTSMGTAVFASSDLPAETQSDQKTESEGNLHHILQQRSPHLLQSDTQRWHYFR